MANLAEDEEVRLRARHIKAALSTRHLDRAYKTATPSALEAHAMRQATRLNLVFRNRPSWAINARFAIAGPKKIHLPHDFHSRAQQSRAALLMHELVHVRQWRDHGTIKMGGRYAFDPRWRAAYEIAAYRESMRAHIAMGWTQAQALRGRVQYLAMLVRDYGLGMLDTDQLIKVAFAAWEVPDV